MAPSINVVDTDVHAETESKKKKRKSKDLTALQENADVCDDSSKKKKKKKKVSVNNDENDSNPGGEETELIKIVAKYLSKRGLSKTLSSFISETQCENSWKLQTADLEDIFNQYLNHERENSMKFKVKDRNMEQGSDPLSKHHVNQNSSVKFQEQEIQGKNGSTKSEKVVNSASGTLPESGDLEQGIGRSDTSDDSSDAQDKSMQGQKKKTHKGTGKKIDPNTKKRTKEKESGVPTSVNRENGSSNKDIVKPTTPLKESENILEVEESLQESLEGPKGKKTKKKKKKKNSEDKDSVDNDEQKTSADRENKSSTKGNANPSKASQKSENILDVDESLQGSLEVPKEKRRKKKNPEDKDSEDNDKQDSAEKTKKEKKALKKKLQSSGSHETNEDTSKNSLKDSTEDVDKSLVDTKSSRKSQAKEVDELEPGKSVNGLTDAYGYQNGSTPGQKGVIEVDGEEQNISSNSNQKSDVPTASKAFQRVKVQEVEFADPRLQNNSYWAKDGAEMGYGAKAQEVLGQVRGKDFRHEKTKKKRGSYKGGLIDLQAHSIKFSYSDED